MESHRSINYKEMFRTWKEPNKLIYILKNVSVFTGIAQQL
jgi:hypothetical protein